MPKNDDIPVTGVTLSRSTLSLVVDGTTTLSATVQPEDATNKSISWESSDTTVATVNANGKVSAIAPGTATITVTTEDGGKTATCAVTVRAVDANGPDDDDDPDDGDGPGDDNGSGDIDNPRILSFSLQLTAANWTSILEEIAEADEYVALDLSACTRSSSNTGGGLRSDGTFDPLYTLSTGKNKIVSIILPTAANTIVSNTSTLGYSTFRNFTVLNTVTGNNISVIGDNAFRDCTGLASISFPNATSINQSTFYDCTSLTEVSFPNVTSIGNYAFRGCTSLTEVSFPSAASIGSYAFVGCTSLINFILSGAGSLSVIENGKALVRNNTELVAYPSASGSIVINAITSINSGGFYGCTNLTSADFPNVTDIGSYIFYDCTGLTSVSFPNATSIGLDAFLNCTSLTSVNFPEATSYIGGDAFNGCTNLTDVDFPKVTGIYNSAFYGCTSLTAAIFPNVTSIGNDVFYGCTKLADVDFPKVISIGNNAFRDCASLISIDSPIATSIGSYVFMYCTRLTTAIFPLVTSIGLGVFMDCASLTDVELPRVTGIPNSAFYGCTSITRVAPYYYGGNGVLISGTTWSTGSTSSTGSRITYVDDAAFYGCTSLTTVTITGSAVLNPNIAIFAYAFSGCTSLTTMSIASVRSMGTGVFAYTGDATLTITMRQNAPTVDGNNNLFEGVDVAKDVFVVTTDNPPIGYTEAWKAAFTGGNENINLTVDYRVAN